MSVSNGILNVTVVEAELTRDTEMISSMSPYCTLTHKNKKHKTKVKDYAGKLPKFGDEFQFVIEEPSEEIFVRVWDQGNFVSDAVGFVKVKASSLMLNCHVDDWFNLFYENNSAGKIRLIGDFAPEGGDVYAQMQEKYDAQQVKLEAELAEAQETASKLEEKQKEIEATLAAKEAELAAKQAELEAAQAEASDTSAYDQQKKAMEDQKKQLQMELQFTMNAKQNINDPNGAGYGGQQMNQLMTMAPGMIPQQSMAPMFQNPMMMGGGMGMQQPGMMPGMNPMMGGMQQPMMGMQQPMMGGMPGMMPPMGMGMQPPMMGGMMPMGGSSFSSSTTTTTTSSSSSMMMPGMGMPMQQPMMGGMPGMGMQQPGMMQPGMQPMGMQPQMGYQQPAFNIL